MMALLFGLSLPVFLLVEELMRLRDHRPAPKQARKAVRIVKPLQVVLGRNA